VVFNIHSKIHWETIDFHIDVKKKGCGVLLTIDKKELDKLKFGGSAVINYYISKEHSCIDPDLK